MTRWMHPPELERQREQAEFDPAVEGARLGLSRELALAIWRRVCADATDGFGRLDAEEAQRQFHQIAGRIAARGGRLRPDVGRLTRVGDELAGTPVGTWGMAELAPRIPGRETLVTVEARRWAALSVEPAAALDDTEATDGSERDRGTKEQHELPHASEVAQAMDSLQRPSPPDPARDVDAAERTSSRRRVDADAVGAPAGRDQSSREGRLPVATLERMEQAYGQRFDDVEIHADSAEVPAGQQAFTRGRHIYFERGAFEPERDHGEHVIAHELAHVAQQLQPASQGRRPATRAALEADAHQAALAALAGRVATVNLFAPPSAALGFSNGKPQQPPASARGSAGRLPGQSARGGTPTSSSGAARTPGAMHTPGTTRAPTSAGSGSTGARSGAVPTTRPAAAHAAASAAPTIAATRRGVNADGLLVPEAPSTLTPATARRLQALRTDNQGVAAATTTLPTAAQQTDVARAAVVEPQAEQDAHAQHGVVAAVDDRPPPSPEIEAACARIREVIKAKRPPDEDKLVDAKPREMAQEAGEQMSAGVEQRAGTVRQGYADMQKHPQGTPSTTPVPATLPPERAPTSPVDATAGAPDPLHHDDVSLDGDVAAQQQRIQDAGMNTEAGQLVKDGSIGDARGGVDDLQTMAKTDPQKVLADQAAAIAHAKGDMHALQAAAEKALAEARSGTVTHIGKHTTNVKASEEQQRASAGAQMQAIFTRTQRSVDTLLQPLSKNAVARWEAGVAQLSTDFEASLADVKQKIEKRHHGHGGLFGGVEDLWDQGTDAVFGLPDWVTKDYDRAEAKFADGATSLITDISRDVNQVIDDCKKLIDQARKDIEAIVHSLPASLQTWARGEADKLGKQLDQLSQRVDETQHGLDQDLVHRANGAVQTVRERVAELREQAKGLLGKIADAIAEFIKNPAKAIINGLLHILGIPPASFWALVDKLGDVISGIAAEPKKFANTLMAGVGQGFQQFFHSLPTHLGQALFQWLFGKLGEAGVTMPTDFSMRSILTLVLEVMGITWTRIKTILAKHIGAENAELLDQAIKLIQVLIDKGPQGVFELIAEQLDPAMIIDAIKDAAIQYVMQAIITNVSARILMMLNPAGAILQAIEAIYRVIKWVIDNAARIFTLIESIVNGAAQILAGNVSGVANLVESSLVRLMVPVIDFLADYLGLGGIPDAIKRVILGLQGKVEKILDRVIGFVVAKARALWEALKNRGKLKDAKDEKESDDEHKPDNTVGSELHIEHAFSGGNHSHKITTNAKHGSPPDVVISSDPLRAGELLQRMADAQKVLGRAEAAKVPGLLVTARKELLELEDAAKAATSKKRNEPGAFGPGAAERKAVDDRQAALGDTVVQLLDLFHKDGILIAEIGWKATGNELRLLVHDVIDEMLELPAVKAKVREVKTAQGTESDPVPVIQGEGMIALGEGLHERKDPTWWKKTDYNMPDGTTTQEQRYPGTQVVLNAHTRKADLYAEIVQHVNTLVTELKQQPGYRRIGQQRIALMLKEYVASGELPEDLAAQHRARLNEIVLLLFGREAQRNRGMTAFGPMSLELLIAGQTSFEDTFDKEGANFGGGESPMSFAGKNNIGGTGPVKAARLDRAQKREPIENPTNSDNRALQELINREIALAESWLRSVAPSAWGAAVFESRDAAKAFVKGKLFDFYGVDGAKLAANLQRSK